MSDLKDLDASKLLIVGLDNSGKTCILLSLKEETNLLSLFSLTPTKGVNINTYESRGKKIACWDLGGQEQYRKEYLKNFKKYITGTEKIIYVIDVQDFARYDLSIKYFGEIMHLLKKEDKKVELMIFLHKYDPGLSKQDKFRKVDDMIGEKLLPKIKELIPPDIKYNVFKTTVYTVFDKTLYE